MENQTFLSEYPNLEEWYFHRAGQENQKQLFDLCRSLNHSEIQNVSLDISKFLTQIFETTSNLKSDLECLEELCLLQGVEINAIYVKIIESSITENCISQLFEVFKNLAMQSKSAVYCFFSAWMALNTDQLEECIELCDITDVSNSDFKGLAGQANLELQNFEEALACFEAATEEKPLDPIHWFWLAKSAFALNRPEEAWQASMECYKLRPTHVEACLLLGIIASEENFYPDNLIDAWTALWGHLQHTANQGLISGILFEIGFKLEDEDKMIELINQLNFRKLASSSDFSKNLGSILKGLNKQGWFEANKLFIDRYESGINPS